MLKLIKSKVDLIKNHDRELSKSLESLRQDHKREIERLELKYKTELSDQKINLESKHRLKIQELEAEHLKALRQEKTDNDRLLLIERNKVENKLSSMEKDCKKINNDKELIKKEREFLGILFMKANVLRHGIKERKKELDTEHANTIRILDEFAMLQRSFEDGKVELSEYDGIPKPGASVIKDSDL